MSPGLVHPIMVALVHINADHSCLSKLRCILTWLLHTLESEYKVKWSLPISSSGIEVSSIANQGLNDPAVATLSSKVQWGQAIGEIASIDVTTFLCKQNKIVLGPPLQPPSSCIGIFTSFISPPTPVQQKLHGQQK